MANYHVEPYDFCDAENGPNSVNKCVNFWMNKSKVGLYDKSNHFTIWTSL